MITRIKIYGERNTGTNYLTELLTKNFPIKALSDGPPYWWEKRFGLSNLSMTGYFLLTEWKNLGWKHAAPNIKHLKADNCVFIIVTKNPYSWLLSLHKSPYHNWQARDLSFSDFLRTPWPLLSCEGINGTAYTPVDLWNIKHRAYLQAAEVAKTCIVVRYEDILENPENFLRNFSGISKLPIDEDLLMVSQGVKSKDKEKSFDHYKNYYLNELWRGNLIQADVAYINQSLDTHLSGKLGYSII